MSLGYFSINNGSGNLITISRCDSEGGVPFVLPVHHVNNQGIFLMVCSVVPNIESFICIPF